MSSQQQLKSQARLNAKTAPKPDPASGKAANELKLQQQQKKPAHGAAHRNLPWTWATTPMAWNKPPDMVAAHPVNPPYTTNHAPTGWISTHPP